MLVLLLAGCGNLPQGIENQEAALTGVCNRSSDPACVGLSQGASCDGNGACRLDPDYPGACDCVVPTTTPPPPPACHCADGSVPGQACGWGGTCRYVFTGQMLYCACS
jgi:hypothetical protein